MKEFFASTARGLEELLKVELEGLNALECKITQGGVYFSAHETVLYSILLWSRLASRIFMPLKQFTLNSDQQLYDEIRSINWSTHFSSRSTFIINVTGTNSAIRHSQYGALKAKDAIVDYFMATEQSRPMVEKSFPDIRLNLFIEKDKGTISLDLSGDSLHHRGYRHTAGLAPLKENLAAAIILRSGWKIGTPFIDPMCGSGTLVIEAAMIAADIAPGLRREYWGFSQWKQHQATLWQSILHDAKQRAETRLEQAQPVFYGYDQDHQVIEKALSNAKRAGVHHLIHFKTQEIAQLTNPFCHNEKGTLVSNPPYGERLSSEPGLIAVYSLLGQRVKTHFPGWQLSLFSASPELLSCLQLRASKQIKAKNGPLDCIQKNYAISEIARPEAITQSEENITPSFELAADFANRLKKNQKKIEKWAKQQSIDCYRLYDADLPEYNVAIDKYGDYVVIQEYAPPKTVNQQKARQRLFDILNATASVLHLPSSNLILKVREKQKGRNQYQKLSEKGNNVLVHEYNARFWVNLTDYLDTGLFLDHRLVRKMIGSMSKGKDFLNLFAYTGSATIHAGLGGAKSTTTVDMSYTYLEWAEKNLDLNGLTGREHRLIQADCLQWLSNSQQQFDLIFIDPPTFSNSKRMDETFDVQRDHITLMMHLKKLLRQSGHIIFSNNRRDFKMDHDEMDKLALSTTEITEKTQSLDFERNKKIHNCWLIEHK